MNPLALLTVGGSLFVGVSTWIDDHPQVFLAFRCERLPGETETEYSKREMNRLDGIMQKMIAQAKKMRTRWEAEQPARDELLKKADGYQAKRTAAVDGLQALSGGIATHPESGYAAKPSARVVEFDRQLRVRIEEARKADEVMDERMRTARERTSGVLAEFEAITKKRQQDAAKQKGMR